jgi:hypothetical protein
MVKKRRGIPTKIISRNRTTPIGNGVTLFPSI